MSTICLPSARKLACSKRRIIIGFGTQQAFVIPTAIVNAEYAHLLDIYCERNHCPLAVMRDAQSKADVSRHTPWFRNTFRLSQDAAIKSIWNKSLRGDTTHAMYA